MKTISAIKSYLSNACAFFALFEFVIFLFGIQVTTFTDAITFATAGIIFLFSCMVVGVNYVFKIKKLITPLKLLIHFVALGICFFALFSIVGSISVDNGIGDVFILFVVYLILYAVFFALIFGAGKVINAIERRTAKPEKSEAKSKKTSEKGKSEEYRNLFSDKG